MAEFVDFPLSSEEAVLMCRHRIRVTFEYRDTRYTQGVLGTSNV